MPATVDNRISVWNSFVRYLGHREWQMESFCRKKDSVQPELINYIKSVNHAARIEEKKATPRCLWKMYQSTCLGIRSNISVLIGQAYQRMVEEEQLITGWNA